MAERIYNRTVTGWGVFIASVVRTWVCHLLGIFRIRLLHHGIPDRPLEVLPATDRRAAGDRGLGVSRQQLLALSCARARSADLPVFRASITLALGRKPEAIRLLPHPPTISKHWAT